MDVEEDPSGSSRPHQTQNQDEAIQIQSLLALARQRINEGSPGQALQAVVMALKASGGESAVLHTLQRARELYNNRMQVNLAADQLASLFAECAIAEASPSAAPPGPTFHHGHFNAGSLVENSSEASILAENGRMQVVMDAFADGSSFICLRCGGLVSNTRKDEHIAYWCSNAPP